MISPASWITIGNVDDIPIAGSRVVVTPVCNIAVFRTADNEIYALEDRCPHRGGPISQGIVHDRQVTCPLHNYVIDLTSGETQEPGTAPVCTVSVRVEDNGEMLLNVQDIRMRAVE